MIVLIILVQIAAVVVIRLMIIAQLRLLAGQIEAVALVRPAGSVVVAQPMFSAVVALKAVELILAVMVVPL
jgi:N-methylhydantoinase B/oxoprolinase/acetone carboxylase alpha subunit